MLGGEKMKTKHIGVMDLFPIPVHTFFYENYEQVKNIIGKFLDIEKSDNKKFPYINGYTSYRHYNNILSSFDLLNDLGDNILDSCSKISKDIGITADLEIKNSWFNINRKNSLHEMHTHLPNMWSGIYYVDAEENDAPLVFKDMNKLNNWPWTNVTSTNYAPQVLIKPMTGNILIFPSFLLHEVKQQTSSHERISISFNVGATNAI